MMKKFVAAGVVMLSALIIFGCQSQQERADFKHAGCFYCHAEQTRSKAGRRSEGDAGKARQGPQR